MDSQGWHGGGGGGGGGWDATPADVQSQQERAGQPQQQQPQQPQQPQQQQGYYTGGGGQSAGDAFFSSGAQAQAQQPQYAAPAARQAPAAAQPGVSAMPPQPQPPQQFPPQYNGGGGAASGYGAPPQPQFGGTYAVPHGGAQGPPPQQTMGFGQPAAAAAAAFGVSDSQQQQLGAVGGMAANLVGQYGRDFIRKQGGWCSLHRLKYYFNVNNSYVVSKLRLLFLPFLHRSWKREPISHAMDGSGQVYYKPPREDVNAPDLYIPTMAFLTYVLLYGLALGVNHTFNPEVLGLTASSSFVLLLLEVGMVRMGFYLLGEAVQPPSLLDLTAIAAYKFVGSLVALVLGICFGYTVALLAALASGAMMMIFVMRTMKGFFAAAAAQVVGDATSKRNYFLLVVGVFQIFSMWLFTRWAFPSPEAADALASN